MSAARHYQDACATAHALDLIGERWALLVMRELMLGPRRFGDLRASLEGLSANVLTQRLEGLEASGVVRRRKLPPPASVQVYELTEWGLEAEPILLSLGRWAVRSPFHDQTLPFSAVALMLSYRAKFDPARTAELDLTIGFTFAEGAFTVQVRKGVLLTERGETAEPTVRVSGAPSAVAGLFYGKVPLEAMEAAGALSVTGDRQSLQAFADSYVMPPPASAPAQVTAT